MDDIKNTPVVGNILSLIDQYPRITAWIVLSVGIVALLIYEARDVDLTTINWIVFIVASVLVAGLCIWIVSWEDEEEMDAAAPTVVKSSVGQDEVAAAKNADTTSDETPTSEDTPADDTAAPEPTVETTAEGDDEPSATE